MTGTPLDLTPFGSILKGINILYWLLALGALMLALIKPKSVANKSICAGVVLLIFGWYPATVAWAQYKAQQRLIMAMARFEERCERAGEKIMRTVDEVDGILLMKVMPALPNGADRDAMWPEAGIPDRVGDDYIMSFLRNTEKQPEYKDSQGNPLYPGSAGYSFVDVIDQTTGTRIRYTAPYVKKDGDSGDGVQKLMKKAVTGDPPKFGITYEAFVDPEDRKFWVAGGSIQIIDLEKNQVIAEKTGFLIDPGQGSTAGFRDAWGWAQSYGPRCPEKWGQGTQGRIFADQVLKIKRGA